MDSSVFQLNGKVALITGASKGIGEAAARMLARQGAHVVINSRKAEELKPVAEAIAQAGGACDFIAGNVGDTAFCTELVAEVVKRAGGLDILVNNAATNPVYGPVVQTEGWAFDKIMSVNVKSPFELARLAYPHMKACGGGSIVNISSVAGDTPDPGLGIYSVSKAALNMLTKVLAKEWGVDGIRVNAVAPGLIKTKFSEALWQNEKMLNSFLRHMALPRMGTSEEMAALILFLASPASAYCTGTIFTADGGITI
ncbi:MAG: SDR family NAD(P)-dependent oxidoreductase [Cyclobacteriaceae bacterium]|jgi:dehydrogenase/reductase SDR family protein 4|nr:glucose 1-dehydrogenase [Flammeovirgaceae bacterium]